LICVHHITKESSTESILAQVVANNPQSISIPSSKTYDHRKKRSMAPITRPTHLIHQTTSEHDNPLKLPPMPEWLHNTYSCQRPTSMYSPNDAFINQLKNIKHIRELRGDEIGVRAYSTAIASIAAYPYAISSPQEILRLPGCSGKYATLFEEWKEKGHCLEADEIGTDEQLQVLDLFWNIWGVGPGGARNFYNNGWRDLDDVIMNWDRIKRVQQIGVKYYDEFLLKIPRREVESIGSIILEHANKLHPGFQICIVGGYRRGKENSGDVDVILSHPNEKATLGAIKDIAEALAESGYITHTLILSVANSERGQTPVSWKGDSAIRGSGFDTLDKALVVWQDPAWEKDVTSENPNPHRRVDILISPWKTFGCAVMGWTSGTTFQRDLRNYCRKEKHLKFDSSGIRSMEDGHWVDFESVGGKAPDFLTAEKRVFEGLGLEWREPTERCTG
jgi:DNA polymerase IV